MKQTKRLIEVSKYMSWALRHKPDEAGIVLDEEGWADIYLLVNAHNQKAKVGKEITVLEVLEAVRTCEKQRYAVSEDLKRVRANQGHSINVDVGLTEAKPPARLYHGTATRFYPAIHAEGLKPMSRQHVHLSADYQTAHAVGGRHGMPFVIGIDSGRMYREGIKFWQSANGVWLVHEVAPKYHLRPIKENA